MPTYSISETETFDRTSVISDAHFGVNFVSHSDFEFLAGSQQAETLASLGATNFRFPGGGITEGDFADASFLTGNWAADSHGTRTLTPMSDFFATAGEVNADVQFVIPTRVAFATSSGQSLWNLHQGNSGEHYGARTAIDPNYFTLLTNYIEEALSLASHNGVEISTFEIGNEFWLGGEMSASEYGYLAGEIAAWLNDNYPGVDILVQATNTVGVFSPFNNETVYLEAITGEGGETDYTVHTSEPDGVAVTSVTVPAQGNWAAQTRDLAQAIANNPDGVTAIDGVLFHNYFDDGFAGIDTEDEQKLEQVYDRFASFTGRSDLEFHITEWSPDTNNDSGLQNAQSYIEGFFELVQWGVDGADAWPLTYANPETRNRNLIDTGDAQSHLTFAGVAFQWLSESTEGLEAKFDYEVTGQIDVHGFGNANRLVAFVGERSGTAQANTIVDFNNFALNGDYFVVVSSMGDSGAGGISNSAAPDLVFSDGVVASGDTVALDLEGWDLARIEMTAVTDNADKLIGRDGNDTITAEGGNDKVSGNGGNDSLKGQLGNDTLKGDDGNDTLKAGHGNDKLYGGFGDDFLDGGEGNDYLRDDSGADQFIGGGGSDTASYWGWHSGRADNSKTLEVNLLTGVNNSGDTYSSIENLLGSNNQRDKFVGTNGTNELDGAGGHDTLHGLDGDDNLIGREGDDRLYGGSGNDTLDGGDGDDYLRDEGGKDHYIGGSGSDTASYWGWYASQAENSKTLTVNLSTGVNNSGDTYNSIENLLGSDKQKNHLTGTNGVNDLEGGVGEDSLYGLGGNDALRGDAGKDQLFGGAGNDKLYGGSGSDTLEGGEGNDYLRDDSGADQFIGGGGLDTASY
ncbi:calcium-binding protein, partial [Synechococcus sp. MU1644]|nr:calcium-binding protein [Synechococcus sp. MU1644]